MSARSPSRFILVDGNNLFYRAYYVFVTLREKNGETAFASKAGYPTGLIYGAFSILSDWIGSISRPSKIIFFLDGIPRKRLDLDPLYKFKNDDAPVSRGPDLPIILSDGFQANHDVEVFSHILQLFGVDICHGQEEEADDLIASFVKSHPDDIHIIISSDKDFYSLLADNVVLYRPGVEGSRFFDVERATDDMKKVAGIPLHPSNLRMFKSLVGDKSDNIPGVPRLRKKVAALLCHYSDPDSFFASGLPGFSKKERENTIGLTERIKLNYLLVGMDDSVDLSLYIKSLPIDFTLGSALLKEDLDITGVDIHAFRFQEVGRMIVSPGVPDWLSDI